MFLWRIVERSGFCCNESVIMPNHFHLLLTPATKIPLEKALQFIKGGFSYRAKREIHFAFEIWQASFVNHRIRDAVPEINPRHTLKTSFSAACLVPLRPRAVYVHTGPQRLSLTA
jgi:hypothetical protein